MSLTSAQFLLWLKDQASRVTVLAELTFVYQSKGSPATLNPADKGTGVTLSGGNLTANFAAVNPMVRATQPLFVGPNYWLGKYYWEVTVGSLAGGVGVLIGIAKAGATLNNYLASDANGWAYYTSTGDKFNTGVSSAYGATCTTGDVVGVAVDIIAGTITFYKNGVSQGVAFTGLTGTFFPAVSGSTGGTEALTVNFGATAFSYTPPVDYAPLYNAAPVQGTVYLSDRGYVSKPTDSPASQRYRSVIASAPDFERALSLADLGGRGEMSEGDLTLSNLDGSLDFLLDVIIDGRDIALYLGDRDWPRADFRLVNSATVASVKANNDGTIALALRDKSYLLDATMIGSTITTGPNAGKPKPILMGYVTNFDLSAYLVDATGPTYAFNNFASDVFLNLGVTVRDAGVSLSAGNAVTGTNATITADAGTDTITKVAHGLNLNDVCWFATAFFAGLSTNTQYWAVNVTADTWQFSLTRGGAAVDITGTTFAGSIAIIRNRYYGNSATSEITLSSSPSGRVTLDIFALGTSGDALLLYNPHAAFRYILDTFTRLTAADRDAAAFATLVAAEASSSVFWGRAILDRTNVLDVLDEIATLSNSWYGWTAAGILSVGKLDLQNLDAASAIDTVTQDDIEGEPSCENFALQFGKIIYDATPNVVRQTDGLATSVSATNRSKWAQSHQARVTTTDPAGSDYPNDWWTYHKTAIDSRPLATQLYDLTGAHAFAQAVCDERTELFRPWTRVFRCTVGLDKYALNPGDCVNATYPRYGMSAGKKFRVASVKPRLSERVIDLVLVRRTIPDYTTASYV